jgi:hypothetical protein
MNLGAPELIILVMIPLIVATIGLTIWALVDSGQRGQTGWLIGIIVGWVFGLGWLVRGDLPPRHPTGSGSSRAAATGPLQPGLGLIFNPRGS